MDANDLINPLRYVNLKNINPESINRMGEGVFPEPNTLDHLAIIDLVTKAYQGVHLPTYGQPIPQSTNTTTSTQSTNEATLITANNNETFEILSISCPGQTDAGLTYGFLQIYNPNSATSTPIMDLPAIDEITFGASGLVYGHMLDYSQFKAVPTPSKFLLTGGESLSIKTKNAPQSSIVWTILYRKVSQ